MIVSRKRVSTNPLANLANRPLYESPTIQTKVPVAIPRSLFWNDNVYYHSRRGSEGENVRVSARTARIGKRWATTRCVTAPGKLNFLLMKGISRRQALVAVPCSARRLGPG